MKNWLESPNKTALIIIDWLNPFDFEGGRDLKQHAARAVAPTLKLAERCKDLGIPLVQVNDNFGQWSSDQRAICEQATKPGFGGREIAQQILRIEAHHFVLKPKHSAFYHTVLDLLLRHLEVERLILTGLATNICVLFTANDAHLRGHELWIPSDCCAAQTEDDHEYAITHFNRVLDCHTEAFESEGDQPVV